MSEAQESPWTDEAVDVLRRNFRDGLSCTQSRMAIRAHTGLVFSRSAVIGKRYRLGLVHGLPGQLHSGNRDAGKGHSHFCLPGAKKSAPERATEILTGPVDISRSKILADMEAGDCRFPLESTLVEATHATRFCAEPVNGEGPYCAHHHARAFKPQTAAYDTPSSSAHRRLSTLPAHSRREASGSELIREILG